jgi:hypothetical protein
VSPPSPRGGAEREQGRGAEDTKIEKLLLLAFLTLTALAYNYQFHNIPSYMFLNAYKLSQTPGEYADVTEDGDFRTRVIEYIIACDVIRTGMVIREYDLPYDWLKNASDSSRGYDMTIKYFDDFYFLQVRYYPDFQRTSIEHDILWAINIFVAVGWLYFVLTETPLKKWRMRK